MTPTTAPPATLRPAAERSHRLDRLHVTWTGTTAPEPERRQRLTGLLLEGALDDALNDLGVGVDEVVCLRRVTVPAHRVGWAESDAVVVDGWCRSIAAAVQAAVRTSRGAAELVRYPSPSHAVVDLVVRSVAGDESRAWAWSQLGFWPDVAPASRTEVGDVVARLLTIHPSLVPWVLVTVCHAGLLGALLDLLGTTRTVVLMGSAWAAAGGADLAVPSVVQVVGQRTGRSIVERSSVARAVLVTGTLRPADADPGGTAERPLMPLAVALAAACVLEVESSLAAHQEGPAAVAAVARLLDPAPTGLARDPHHVVTPAQRGRAGVPKPGGVGSVSGVGVEPSAAVQQQPAAGVPSVSSGPSPVAEQGPARTQWGGLLFLLHLVDGPALGRAAGTLPGAGSLKLRLHATGRAVLARAVPDTPPPDDADPALLAFAGLAPGSPPPEPEPRTETAVALLADETAGVLLQSLREHLHPSRLAHAPGPALLLGVCHRPATVVADPGWIDVLLDLDAVSTDVRRAGLDLDLGFLPWLGCVVRFRYA